MAGKQITNALSSAAENVNIDRLAADVEAKLYATILEPTQRTVFNAAALIQGISQLLPPLESALKEVRAQRWSTNWWKAFALSLVLVSFVFCAGWIALDVHYHRSLDEELRQAEARALFNEDSVEQLNKFGRQIVVEPHDGGYRVVLPNAQKVWVTDTGEGIIEFNPGP
jgi:hypothetical protein